MDYFKLAQVLKPQGIKGELKLKPFVDELSRFDVLSHIFLKKGAIYERRAVEKTWTYKQFAFVKIEGCDDRNTAETMRGAFLYIDRAHAAPPPPGAHYIADLVGLEIRARDGRVLGELADVLQTGATDIYVMRGERPCMFPAAPHVVLKKDVSGGCIIVDEQRLQEVAVYD